MFSFLNLGVSIHAQENDMKKTRAIELAAKAKLARLLKVSKGVSQWGDEIRAESSAA
jgi:hypothetical protein